MIENVTPESRPPNAPVTTRAAWARSCTTRRSSKQSAFSIITSGRCGTRIRHCAGDGAAALLFGAAAHVSGGLALRGAVVVPLPEDDDSHKPTQPGKEAP